MSEFFDALKAVAETPTKKLIAFAAAALVALQVSNPKDYFRFGAFLILAYVFFTFFIGGVTRFWEQWKNGSAHINRINDPLSGISDLTVCILADFVEKDRKQFLARPAKLEKLGLMQFVQEAHVEPRPIEQMPIDVRREENPNAPDRVTPFDTMPGDVRLFEFAPEYWQHFQSHKKEIDKRKTDLLADTPMADRIHIQRQLNEIEKSLIEDERYGRR